MANSPPLLVMRGKGQCLDAVLAYINRYRRYSMKFNQLVFMSLACGCLWLPNISTADLSAEVALISDYRDNGISNSDRKPAVQAELAYEHESGAYASGWLSNVYYGPGEPQRAELDLYLGYGVEINESVGLDFGVASYSYMGKSGSADIDYQELYMGANFNSGTELYAYYSPDYTQADTHNIIVSLSHSIIIRAHELGFKAVHYQSGDKNKLAWRENKANYQDFEVSVARDLRGFNLELTGIVTTITDGDNKDAAKPTLVLGLGKAWSW